MMKINTVQLKYTCALFLLLNCFAIHANPVLWKAEEDAGKRFMLEQATKKHPSLKIYHDSVNRIKSSDIYKFRPGYAIVKNREEIGFGPVSKTFATAFGLFEGVVLSPATILGSPWILKKHLELKRVEKVSNILDELYLADRGSKNLERFLEILHLSHPDVTEIQELDLVNLKQFLISLDEQGEFTRSINNEIVDESEPCSFLRPRNILNINELSELVCVNLTQVG